MAKKTGKKVTKKTSKKKINGKKDWKGTSGTIGFFARTLIARVGDSKDTAAIIKEVKGKFKHSSIGPADVAIYKQQVRQAHKYPK